MQIHICNIKHSFQFANSQFTISICIFKIISLHLHIQLQLQIYKRMDIVSRLKRFIDAHQIPVTQFADNCRIPRPTLSQLLNGRNKKVSDEVISKIHEAYPRLSVLWLMFGEGMMETPANIEISEPQNGAPQVSAPQQQPDPLTSTPHFDFDSEFSNDESENSRGTTQAAAGPIDKFDAPARSGEASATITFGDKGKRVISIVVYYDDNSYESFVPDPTGRSPFAR